MTAGRVLLIEDDPDGRRSVEESVADAGFEVVAVADGESGVNAALSDSFDVILTDLILPDIDGIEVLRRIRKLCPAQPPVIVMTAFGSVDSSVRAMREGAYDYIPKPLDLDDLQAKVARAVERQRLRMRVEQLNNTLYGQYAFSSMIAISPAMKDIGRQIEAAADTMATVLIQGESGTGKELVARALHVESRRREGPFVAVNCGAFAETLLESELFGHEKGAFTGAVDRRKGAFERADGGTLFLDEVGDAPKSVQVKLLRVMEDREVVRVGGQSPFKVQVRLVAATNKNLDRLADQGEFRSDLLYRLRVITMHLPALRDRREDIRPLADRFIAAACEEHGRYVASVDVSFYKRIEQHDWPGNVRELRNVIESAVIMARDNILRGSDIRLAYTGSPSVLEESRSPIGVAFPEGMTLDEIEKDILVQMLKRYDGNRSIVAEKLGLSRRTIQRKIKDYVLPF